MENINSILFLQPIVALAVSLALMAYWYRKRRFHPSVWLYSLIAYFGAIGLKFAVQIPTNSLVIHYFGAASVGTGLYLGLQTVIFEVGLAYLVAWFAVKHHKLEEKDAEAYGSGLAFWENGVYLGGYVLFQLVTLYAILSTSTPIAQQTYDQLMSSNPTLFAPTSQLLSSVAFGTLERISSILFHVAWGYLCFMAVIYHNKRLFLIALPMGLIDFLVPFAASNIALFEGVLFGLAVLAVLAAWYAVRLVKKGAKPPAASYPPTGPQASTLQ